MSDNVTLYEMTMERRNALDNIEVDENGELIGLEALEALDLQIADKTEACGIVIKELKAQAEMIAAEEKALKERKESKIHKAEKLTEYVANMMLMNDMPSLETARVKMSFRKSEAVVVTDEALIPKDYMVETVTVKPDKVGLKKAIKSGEDIPGVVLETRSNLQIK